MSQKESWEEEFDKEFLTLNDDKDKLVWDADHIWDVKIDKIKSFIREVLDKREKEIAEEVEKVRIEKIEMRRKGSAGHHLYKIAPEYIDGSISGIESVLLILKH